MKIEETVVEIRCQKCDVPIIVTPIVEFKGPVRGTLHIPYLLYCAKCGAVMTIATRKRRDDELIVVFDGNIGGVPCPTEKLHVSGTLQVNDEKSEKE